MNKEKKVTLTYMVGEETKEKTLTGDSVGHRKEMDDVLPTIAIWANSGFRPNEQRKTFEVPVTAFISVDVEA